MKAIAKCPKCNEVITTNCKGCIEGNCSYHKCKCGVIDDIKWKKVPETEEELKEVEEEK